jgi:hypothetical protein
LGTADNDGLDGRVAGKTQTLPPQSVLRDGLFDARDNLLDFLALRYLGSAPKGRFA